jgi:isopentenyl-diphosphate delta-isomerase
MPAPSSSSLVDVVDAADRPVSRLERRLVLEQGAKFRVIHIFIFNSQGELLLQQLGRNRDRNPLKWGSSVAGYLHSGEAYADAAVRRQHEELGLSAPLTKHGSISMPDQESTKFITLYVAKVSGSLPRIEEPGHIEALRFWSIQTLEAALTREPESFTETFRYLYGFYRITTALAV